jgi:hypothetical protein
MVRMLGALAVSAARRARSAAITDTPGLVQQRSGRDLALT